MRGVTYKPLASPLYKYIYWFIHIFWLQIILRDSSSKTINIMWCMNLLFILWFFRYRWVLIYAIVQVWIILLAPSRNTSKKFLFSNANILTLFQNYPSLKLYNMRVWIKVYIHAFIIAFLICINFFKKDMYSRTERVSYVRASAIIKDLSSGQLVEAKTRRFQGLVSPELPDTIAVKESLSWIKQKSWPKMEFGLSLPLSSSIFNF